MAGRVRVLNGTVKGTATPRQSRRADEAPVKILTNSYVRELNRGISYRIQQREALHSENIEIVAKARFR